MMSLAEPHQVLKACRAALSERFYVIDLQTKTHVRRRYLAYPIALLESGA